MPKFEVEVSDKLFRELDVLAKRHYKQIQDIVVDILSADIKRRKRIKEEPEFEDSFSR
jgi:mRNA-degrading endonuclease RelE of RelBE toxin-antitoxin system